jgi:hypothetical protein
MSSGNIDSRLVDSGLVVCYWVGSLANFHHHNGRSPPSGKKASCRYNLSAI